MSVETTVGVVRELADLTAACARDKDRVLQAVEVRADGEGLLVATATDSHILAAREWKVEGEAAYGLIPAAPLVAFVKAIGARIPGNLHATLDFDESAVTISAVGFTQRIVLEPGGFPKWERFFDTEGAEPTESIALDPYKIALLAKSAGIGTKDRVPLRFRFQGSLKPVLVTATEGWRGLLMPVRVS